MAPTVDANAVEELATSTEYIRLLTRTTDARLTDAARQEATTALDTLTVRYSCARIPQPWDSSRSVNSLRANRIEDRHFATASWYWHRYCLVQPCSLGAANSQVQYHSEAVLPAAVATVIAFFYAALQDARLNRCAECRRFLAYGPSGYLTTVGRNSVIGAQTRGTAGLGYSGIQYLPRHF